MRPRCYDEMAISRAIMLRQRYAADPQAAVAEIASELTHYSFYHIIEVVPGLETAGISWSREYTDNFAKVASTFDFRDKRVLDIGCRDGAQALCLESAGAAEVHGIDNDFSPALLNFLIPFKQSRLQCHELNLYDLAQAELGVFDVVSCCGVIYHLQFPIWGLKQMRDALRPGGFLFLETAVLAGLGDLPVLVYPTGETSPYELTSPSFFNLAGFQHALGLLGFGKITVHLVFNRVPFEVERHFPQFHALNPTLNTLSIDRVILTCRRDDLASDSLTRSYFEGQHSLHSTGKDRR